VEELPTIRQLCIINCDASVAPNSSMTIKLLVLN
jgi:hypothetical protein